jgi:hypothetical protein
LPGLIVGASLRRQTRGRRKYAAVSAIHTSPSPRARATGCAPADCTTAAHAPISTTPNHRHRHRDFGWYLERSHAGAINSQKTIAGPQS